MTSMLMKDKHPSKFAYFELLRQKFQKQMLQVASADALISAFGEAAAIPFAEWDQLTDPREQLLRFRVLKFTMSRKIWRSSTVSVLALENIAKEDDKHFKTENYKVDRNDLFTLEITVCTLFVVYC